jgi:hypothetical protein
MKRRIEFEMIDTGNTYWAIVEGDQASLNSLYVVLSNHLLIRKASQHELAPTDKKEVN